MRKKIFLGLLFIILFLFLFKSNTYAINPKNINKIRVEDQNKIENDAFFFENGIIIGRTYMTIKSKDAGVLQFVDLNINGEHTKKIKSGVFGFFIVNIPLGRYEISASKAGFYNTSINLGLFWFKPFALGIIKLEKIGWK